MALPPAAEVIQATLAPAFLISGTSVFLNFAQASGTTGTDDPHYVGAMSSFEDPAPNSPGDDIILDAAPALRKLKKNDRILPGDNLTVTLVVAPGSAPDDVSIPIDRVALTVEPKAHS